MILAFPSFYSLWTFFVVPQVIVDVGLGFLFEMILSFSGRPLSLWTSFSGLLLVCSISFGMLHVHFHFFSINFWISSLISFLIYSLFNSMLFNLHEVEYFWVFSLRLVSSLSPLWSENMLDMISIFLNLLRLVLCPTIWSIFENVPCAFERCAFCFFGMKVYIYIYNATKYCYCSFFFSCPFAWNIFFPTFHFQPIGLFSAAYVWVMFSYPFSCTISFFFFNL